MCPRTLCGRADHYGNPEWNSLYERRERLEQTIAGLAGLRRGQFVFHHSLLPHGPWVYLPSGRRRTGPRAISFPEIASPAGFGNPFLTRHLEQRHLLQAGFVDREVGRMVRMIKRSGQWQRALVVVAADHGMSFQIGAADRRQVTPDERPRDRAGAAVHQATRPDHGAGPRAPTPAPSTWCPRWPSCSVAGFRGASTAATRSGPRWPAVAAWRSPGATSAAPSRSRPGRWSCAGGPTAYSAPPCSGRAPGRGSSASAPTAASSAGRCPIPSGATEPGRPVAHFMAPRSLADVDLAGSESPALAAGWIGNGSTSGGRDLAVTVNGRVAAVGPQLPHRHAGRRVVLDHGARVDAAPGPEHDGPVRGHGGRRAGPAGREALVSTGGSPRTSRPATGTRARTRAWRTRRPARRRCPARTARRSWA